MCRILRSLFRQEGNNFINITCFSLLLTNIWISLDIANIAVSWTYLTILRTSAPHLQTLMLFLVCNWKIYETTGPRGKKWITNLAILPPYWRCITLILILPLLLHFFLICKFKVTNYDLALLFSAVVASQKVPRVAIQIDNAQLVQTLEQSLLVVGSDAEDSVVPEAFGQRSTPSLIVFHSPLGALLLNFLFDELAF